MSQISTCRQKRVKSVNVKGTKIGLCKHTKRISTLAAQTGLSRHTLYRWRDKGKEDKDGPYRRFYQALNEPPKDCETPPDEPTLYNQKISPETIAQRLQLGRIGLNSDDIAKMLNISVSTLYKWLMRRVNSHI